jgi:hypothetical protein
MCQQMSNSSQARQLQQERIRASFPNISTRPQWLSSLNLPWVVNRSTSMVGSELNALTISNLFSASTEPSSRKYVTLQDINIPKLDDLPKKTLAEEKS